MLSVSSDIARLSIVFWTKKKLTLNVMAIPSKRYNKAFFKIVIWSMLNCRIYIHSTLFYFSKHVTVHLHKFEALDGVVRPLNRHQLIEYNTLHVLQSNGVSSVQLNGVTQPFTVAF